jgi:hypothetical protein
MEGREPRHQLSNRSAALKKEIKNERYHVTNFVMYLPYPDFTALDNEYDAGTTTLRRYP